MGAVGHERRNHCINARRHVYIGVLGSGDATSGDARRRSRFTRPRRPPVALTLMSYFEAP